MVNKIFFQWLLEATVITIRLPHPSIKIKFCTVQEVIDSILIMETLKIPLLILEINHWIEIPECKQTWWMLVQKIRTTSTSWTEDLILSSPSDDNRLMELKTIKILSTLMEPLSQESRPPLERQARIEETKSSKWKVKVLLSTTFSWRQVKIAHRTFIEVQGLSKLFVTLGQMSLLLWRNHSRSKQSSSKRE
jgi:hypothetical protein